MDELTSRVVVSLQLQGVECTPSEVRDILDYIDVIDVVVERVREELGKIVCT